MFVSIKIEYNTYNTEIQESFVGVNTSLMFIITHNICTIY